MSKIISSASLCALLFSLGCATSKSEDLHKVSYVEISRYMGSWYIMANIPTTFEKGAFNAVESYTWNEAEKRIDINFTYNKGSFDGKEKSIPQKGFIYDKTTNAERRVQVWWPLKFSYIIQDLAEDYSDAIVGVPNRATFGSWRDSRKFPRSAIKSWSNE